MHHSRRSVIDRLPKELGSALRLIDVRRLQGGLKTGIRVSRRSVVVPHRVFYGLASACISSLDLGEGCGGHYLERLFRLSPLSAISSQEALFLRLNI